MRLMAVAPVSRARGLVNGQRLEVCVNVVNGEGGQVSAWLLVPRGCWVEGHAIGASAFDDAHEVIFQVFRYAFHSAAPVPQRRPYTAPRPAAMQVLQLKWCA